MEIVGNQRKVLRALISLLCMKREIKRRMCGACRGGRERHQNCHLSLVSVKTRQASVVCMLKGNKWVAQLHYEGKQRHIGSYRTREEGAAAYDEAACKHHGAGAVCNFASATEALSRVSAAISKLPPPKPQNKSGFRGVTAHGNRWAATLCYEGKQRYLGTYRTLEEAAAA